MACPLFIPIAPLGDLLAIAAPLGDLFGGQCAADRSAVIETETLRRCCNFGYARGCCARAATSDADAVRFMVRASEGTAVEIAWAVERNHHPVAVGRMEIESGSARPNDDLLRVQAHACATSYMRQTHGGLEIRGQIAVAAHP